jgi:PKD repeat protein
MPPSLTASLVSQTNYTITLSATATDSDGINGYQWFFGDMTFTNGANVTHTYHLPGTYSVICYVADNTGDTSYRALTVDVPNTNPPVLLGMTATATNHVLVTYSKAVEPASATNLSHYAITPGVTVLGAAFGSDSKTIVLTTSPLATGVTYTGTVSGVNDLATPPNSIAPSSRATFAFVPFVVWHSYDALLLAGSP